MKNFTYILLFTIILFSGCAGCNRPEPNFEGVLMTNCGSNGIEDFAVVTGSQGILGYCSKLYQVPMFEQKGVAIKDKVTSANGGAFIIEPTYSYQPIRGKGAEIIFNYKHTFTADANLDNIEDIVLDPALLNIYREVARGYTTDSLLNNVNGYEKQVEKLAAPEFESRFFTLNNLTSNLKPPPSLIAAIEKRDAEKQKVNQEKNAIEYSRMALERAKIDAETDIERSRGLTKEIIQLRYIEMLEKTNNKVIVTDGKAPMILNQ